MTASAQNQHYAPFSPTLPAGYILGEFRIESVLGQGSFGITYSATELMTSYPVVIKENYPECYAYRDPSTGELCPKLKCETLYKWALESFEKEAITLRKLPVHTNLVHVTGVFRALNTAYIVMEPIDGQNLNELYPAGSQIEPQLLEKMLHSLLNVLVPLHKQGIIHRDIKPGNIMLTTAGEPVLIDFGAARPTQSTHTATKIGTRGYAPPEQLEEYEDDEPNGGTHIPRPHWDLYALGSTCHQLITGRAPIHGARKLMERPNLQEKYSARLLSSIDKAREADPANRWQSAQDWLDELTADERAAQEEARRQQAQAEARTQNELVQLRTALADALEHGQQTKSKLISAENKATQAEKARQQAVEEYQQAEIQISQAEEARKAAEHKATQAEKARQQAVEEYQQAEIQISQAEEARKAAERKATQAEKARQTAEATVADMQRKLDNTPQGNTDKRHRSYGCSLIVSLLLLAGTGALCYHQYRRAEDSAHMVNQTRQKAETKVKELEDALQLVQAQAQQAQNELEAYRAQEEAKAKQDLITEVDKLIDAKKYEGLVEKLLPLAKQGYAPAQSRLGSCYVNGYGVEKNTQQAYECFRKAAEQGDARGMNGLGTCYELGQGVAQDYNQAISWYRKAIEKGDTCAQTNLGLCYANGLGVKQNYKEATDWFKKSAEQGYATAQTNLGVCYENGWGVKKDINEAVSWYRKAAEQEHANAKKALKRLGK